MQKTWRRRATVGSLVLAHGLLLAVIAAAPPKGTAGSIERLTSEEAAYDDMERAERGSREFPTPGTSTPPPVGEGDADFGPGTESGGAHIEGLGTVSHANIDNNWARLEDPRRT
jgi:hypothetical protein